MQRLVFVSFLLLLRLAAATTTAPTMPPAAVCIRVSVQGDATYCVNEAAVCAGTQSKGACPRQGDQAVGQCSTHLVSYDATRNWCVAPADAECVEMPSGVWGCQFPSQEHVRSALQVSTSTHQASPSASNTSTEKSASFSASVNVFVAVGVAVASVIALVVIKARRTKRHDQQTPSAHQLAHEIPTPV